MPNIFLSSIFQQTIISALGIIKLRRIFETHNLEFAGNFYLMSSLFYISILVYDSSRKSILTNTQSNYSLNMKAITHTLVKNAFIILVIQLLFVLVITNSAFGKNLDSKNGLITIFLIVQFQSISSVFVTLFTVKFGFTKINLISSLSNILFFPIFYYTCEYANLSEILITNFAPVVLPGLIMIPIVMKSKILENSKKSSELPKRYSRFLVIQFSENTANSLNTILISNRIGLDSVGEYSFFSRFALLYDFVPMALFPYLIKKRSDLTLKTSRLITFILFMNAFFITLICTVCYTEIITFLSDGKIQPELSSLLPYLFAGCIISLTSFSIQNSVSIDILHSRAIISLIFLALNLICTWIWLPVYGSSFAYTMTVFDPSLNI